MNANKIEWVTKKRVNNTNDDKDLTISTNKSGKYRNGSPRYSMRIALCNKSKNLFDYIKFYLDVKNDKLYLTSADENEGYKMHEPSSTANQKYTNIAINYEAVFYLNLVEGNYSLKDDGNGIYSVDLVRR